MGGAAAALARSVVALSWPVPGLRAACFSGVWNVCHGKSVTWEFDATTDRGGVTFPPELTTSTLEMLSIVGSAASCGAGFESFDGRRSVLASVPGAAEEEAGRLLAALACFLVVVECV